jgi:hypothetical protein
MNYQTASDYEISSAVLRIRFNGLIEDRVFPTTSSKSSAACHVTCDNTVKLIEFDLNNPSDAWPIIMKNAIHITWQEGLNAGDCCKCFEHKDSVTVEFESNCNALRAAMIVYLMMNEVER